MKRIKILIIALAVALFSSSAIAQTMEEAAAKFQEAAELINGQKFKEAIPVLQKTIEIGADAGEEAASMVQEAQKLLGKMYFQLGTNEIKAKNYQEAVNMLLKAEETADLYGDTNTKRMASRLASNVYMMMGIDSFNAKEYSKALEVFSKGYTQDPQNIKLALFTAQSYAALDSLEKAGPMFKSVIEAGASNSKFAAEAETAKTELTSSMLVAASKAAQASDLEKVTLYCDEVLNAIPSNPEASLLVVQVANNLKKYDLVIERGEAAAAAQTDAALKSDAYLLLGVAYQNKDAKDKAIAALKKVTEGKGVTQAKTLITELAK